MLALLYNEALQLTLRPLLSKLSKKTTNLGTLSPFWGIWGRRRTLVDGSLESPSRVLVKWNWTSFSISCGWSATRQNVSKLAAFRRGRSLGAKILGGRVAPLPIYSYHSKGNWLRYNFAADSFYIMKFCSRLFVLYCRNCPKDDKFRYFIPIFKFSGVTILQGVEFAIFLMIFEWALQQCTALPVMVDIQSAAAEIRRGVKREEDRNHRAKI